MICRDPCRPAPVSRPSLSTCWSLTCCPYAGRPLSEATLLGFIARLHRAWEAAAIARLLAMPVLNVDETSLRVNRKNHWIHVCSGGQITVKRLHQTRGCAAIDAIGIIPRYRGVIVHDCWRADLTSTQCKHPLCGSHLLRELQAVTDSNGWPWAEKMQTLLLIARRQVMRRAERRLSMRHYRRIAHCYTSILEQGRKEMPTIPKRSKGRRGPDRPIRRSQPPRAPCRTERKRAALHTARRHTVL